MNSLRRKLQFQLIMGGGRIKVILPENDTQITLGNPFNFKVLTNLSDIVDVYINSTKIAELEVKAGIAEGTMTISSKGYTLGSIFRVNGSSEEQISNRLLGTMKFVSGGEEADVNVILIDTNNDFNISAETTATYWHPEVQYTKEMIISAETTATFEIVQ